MWRKVALYRPKLVFMFEDVLERGIQISTVQLEFAIPTRFNLNYIDENKKTTPRYGS